MVQLQYENESYAELRSLKKLGHRERNDVEVKQEEDEREERETWREYLMQQLDQLQKQQGADPERKQMLIKELRDMQKEDQTRRERLGNVIKQLNELDEEKTKTGKWTREK